MAKKIASEVQIVPAAEYESLQRDKRILSIILRVIDACYESDPNVAKWKPLRDEVERLMNA